MNEEEKKAEIMERILDEVHTLESIVKGAVAGHTANRIYMRLRFIKMITESMIAPVKEEVNDENPFHLKEMDKFLDNFHIDAMLVVEDKNIKKYRT